MKYDVTELKVQAGAKVKLQFNNNDDMQHNWVLVKPGSADRVGQAAIELGIEAIAKSYIPSSEEVLYHTNLLEPESTETIYFQAPDTPGRYTYVCTVLGHHVVMRGILIVE
ncbi:MAG: plastocyanin/azurin family copper-binding protein [Bacteroidota bacterium]